MTAHGIFNMYCSGMKKVELHEKLNVMGERAFLGCSSLDFIIIPVGEKAIADVYMGMEKKPDVKKIAKLFKVDVNRLYYAIGKAKMEK